VLIVGERGTGKELIAARLHYLSNRWEGEYLKMNCAAIADSILESELFGHEAGAFTGAIRAHQGRFERAHGGTLFLDELATTSALVQEKLLRVIEYGEFERVGGSRTLRCEVRLVAATNEDLPSLAAAGRFRADLLDRLAFDVITLPPLREREQDILVLADAFAIAMAQELGHELFAGFTAEVRDQLVSYRWPGNVRELENLIRRLAALYSEDLITGDIIASELRDAESDGPTAAPQAENLAGCVQHHLEAYFSAHGGELPASGLYHRVLREIERPLIRLTLGATNGNQIKAASVLGLNRNTLRKKIRELDIPVGRGVN